MRGWGEEIKRRPRLLQRDIDKLKKEEKGMGNQVPRTLGLTLFALRYISTVDIAAA